MGRGDRNACGRRCVGIYARIHGLGGEDRADGGDGDEISENSRKATRAN